MTYHHQQASGKWKSLTFCEQMANIGSEIGRAIKWKEKSRAQLSRNALTRALELLDLTIQAQTHRPGLKELTRTRELLVDHILYNNTYSTTKQNLNKYFLQFNLAARQPKH
jgi:hypothetical protein